MVRIPCFTISTKSYYFQRLNAEKLQSRGTEKDVRNHVRLTFYVFMNVSSIILHSRLLDHKHNDFNVSIDIDGMP